MRITIREKNGRTFFIPVPTRFVANRLSARIASTAIQKSLRLENPLLSAHDIHRLFQELIRMKKKYRNFELVYVKSAEGDIVEIKL